MPIIGLKLNVNLVIEFMRNVDYFREKKSVLDSN